MAGTSVATAQVTGAASQVWANNPDLNYLQIKNILKQTATDLGTPGWDVETGAGAVNLEKAVELAKKTQPETYQPLPILSPLTWTGQDNLFPGERPVWVSVPAFSGRVMNIGDVTLIGYQRIRSGPGTGFSQVGVKSPGESITFDAYENNGSRYTDTVLGISSTRWYRIAGTNNWMWAGFIDNNPEQAEQERQSQKAIQQAEEAQRLAEEELKKAQEAARLAEEELKQIEAEQQRQREAFQALVSGITQKYGDPGLLLGSWVSNGVTVYQFTKGQALVQPDGRYSFYDATAKSSQVDKSSSRFQLHIAYEKLAKVAIYAKNYSEGEEINGYGEEINGYKVEKVFRDDLTGLYAVGLSKQGMPPVLVFRGTEPTTLQDILTDLDPRGTGTAQLTAAFRQGVGNWLEDKNRDGVKPDVVGHSLGGALAQMTTASYSDNIGQTVTFNSPGIDEKWLLLFKGGDVTHYISRTDLVSQGGAAFLPGRFYRLSFAGDPLKQHTDLFLYDPNVICVPIAMDEISDNDLTQSWLRYPIEFLRQQVGMQFSPTYALVEAIGLSTYIGEKIVSGVGNAIQNGFDFLSSVTSSAIEVAKQKAEAAKQKAQELADIAKAAYQTAKTVVQQAQAAYQTFKQEIDKRTTQIVQQSQQKVKEIAQSIAQKVMQNPVVQTASKVFNQVANYANKTVQAVSNVINGAKQFVSNVIETGKQIVNNVIQTGKQAYETVSNFVSSAVNQGTQIATATYNTAAQAVNNVTNFVSGGFSGVKSLFGW